MKKQRVGIYTVSGLGRDLAYTLYSSYLLVFLTDALGLKTWELVAVGIIMAIARIWDAINDPLMGIIIDNRTTRWGKFKPWILVGAITSAICFILLFQDFNLEGAKFLILFTIIYVMSDMTYTMNDIAYWSMYPTFTTDAHKREKIGSQARMFASIGMFITIALVPIIYQSEKIGNPKKAFSIMSIVIASIFLISQILVTIFVRESEDPIMHVKQEKTRFKDILRIIFKNDQLVILMLVILFLNIGYFITTSLGIYFFNYDFVRYGGVEFMIFSVILAISQLIAIILLPILTKKFKRRQVFTLAFILMAIGYLSFALVGYVLPMNMIVIGIAGFVLFFGQGFMQVLHIIMLADTIEYGQWKLGTRNESVIFAVNPFVVKLATSVQTLVVALTLAFTGLNEKVINPLTEDIDLANRNHEVYGTPKLTTEEIRHFISQNITSEMRLGLRLSMLIIPFLFVLGSYLLYRFKFKVDEDMHRKITTEIRQRVEMESINIKFFNVLNK
ncbi:MAG: MFS transporter [Acholeplasmataceae bacterium]|jgi:melibiose permease